jgi:hypothetical protein
MVDGWSVLRAWRDEIGPPWRAVRSGADHYRLNYGNQNVLYCRDSVRFVSAFVHLAQPQLAQDVLVFGTSNHGYDDRRRGIRLRVPADRFTALLGWCQQRIAFQGLGDRDRVRLRGERGLFHHHRASLAIRLMRP